MKGIRRIICALLALVFLFGLVPMDASVAAAEAGQLGEAIIEGNRDFKWPVPDYHNISACFFDDRDHYAIDIGTITTNADIVASYDGEVAEITRNGANDYGYGNAVMLKHTYTTSSGTITLYSRYAHMSEISESLSVGSVVVGGETVLGKTGGSGYGSANYYAVHLDFQILTSNDWLNRQTCSIDPFANNLLELPADLYLGRTSDCCQSYIDAIKALYAGDAHTHSYESAVTPPTCTEDGYTTYTCSCGDKYTDDEVTAPGHSYGADGVCTVCGELEALGGTCGDNLTWELDANGVLTISGTGDMYNYNNANKAPWYNNKADITSLVIESGVTSVGNYTFYGYGRLTEITIPEGVTCIGDYAFYECISLQKVVLPDSVTSIGKFAFYRCEMMTEITIPAGVTSIGDYAFSKCALTEVTIPAGITKIGDFTFSSCYLLTEITIPGNVISIGPNAFNSCSNLEKITISEGVSSINYNAFLGCRDLREISIPSSVTSIGASVFENCDNLRDVYYGGTEEDWITLGANRPDVKNIHYSCVDVSNHWYGEYNNEPNCTEIGGTYKTCDCGHRKYSVEIAALGHTYDEDEVCTVCGTAEVFLSGTCRENLRYVFYDSGKLVISGTGYMKGINSNTNEPWYKNREKFTSLVIEPGVTGIGSWHFESCIALREITIPNSVTSIDTFAFRGCSAVTDVYFGGTSDEWIALGEHRPGAKYVHYSCASAKNHWESEIYKDASCSEAGGTYATCSCGYEKLIAETAPALGHSYGADHVCTVCGEIQLISKGDCGDHLTWTLDVNGVMTVSGNGAMDDCEENIYDDSILLTIWRGWESCKEEIKKVIVEEGVTSIGWNAFRLLPNLESVEIADSVSHIGSYAFASCDNLKDISFGSGLQSTRSHVFYGCDSIERVVLPNADVDYGPSFFGRCVGLKEIVFPEKVTTIDGNMFYECTGLEHIIIPETIRTIENHAFKTCVNLKTVKFLGSAPDIGYSVFGTIAVTAYYPEEDSTWTKEFRDSFGTNVTWIPYAHEHVYSDVITNPTCTEDGYTTYTCYCGDSYTDSYVEALGHVWDVTDCTAAKVCIVCGESRSAEDGHSWQDGECGAPKTCSICKVTEGTIEHTEINGACSACGAISVSETNFPDANFRKYVSEKIGGASDGWLTEDELKAVTGIYVNYHDIASLKGIEFFTSIETLICSNNSLTELDLSKNTKLKSLDCQNNSLTELVLSNNTELDYLECSSNALTALDISKNSKLDILSCSANALTELDLSGCPVLQNLYCSSNKLTSIDLSVCPTLRDLDCGNNKLTSLDVRSCRNLWILKCGTNELTSLNTEGCKSLSEFYCSNNALTSLDLSTNTMLHKLDCSNNALESITLAEKLRMEIFDCSYNCLEKLELTSCTVHSFDCSYNSLVKLDLAGCTVNRLNAQYNIRVVTGEQNKFDMSTLPGFDVSKVVEVVGGTLDGSIITAEDVAVGYYYDCGNELAVGFVLVIENFCQHNWSEGNCTEVKICSLCGATDGEAPGHDMSDWVITEEPTCTEDGTKRKECSRCDHFETEVIPAAHDMGDWYTVTEATADADGEDRRDCSRCDHYETRVTSFVDNMLKLEGEDFLDETTVYINGLPYPVVVSGDERYVELPTEEDCSIVTYDFHVGDPDDIHTQYPVGMKVYIVSDGEITYVEELDNLLQYSGSSIRITGKKGIRMITSLYKNTKSALAGKGLAGYKLVEYGTVLAFAHEVEGDGDLVLGKDYSRSNYAYKRGVSDPVYANKGDLTQYTNVLVGFNLDQCKEDLAMRPYIILENAEGEQFTIYGGTIYRSIGYVAYQNRNAVKPGTAAYNFVWEIIHHVYGDKYDSDYKG